jgi:hypothetical protein
LSELQGARQNNQALLPLPRPGRFPTDARAGFKIYELGGYKMTNFSAKVTCPGCAVSYQVELRRMRLNIHNRCPACGRLNTVSEGQAIRAQRFLERLELKEKAKHFPRSGALEKTLLTFAEREDGEYVEFL